MKQRIITPSTAVGAPLGGYDSLSAFHALNALDSVDTLPDVSDLIASAAFQENFLNGAPIQAAASWNGTQKVSIQTKRR